MKTRFALLLVLLLAALGASVAAQDDFVVVEITTPYALVRCVVTDPENPTFTPDGYNLRYGMYMPYEDAYPTLPFDCGVGMDMEFDSVIIDGVAATCEPGFIPSAPEQCTS